MNSLYNISPYPVQNILCTVYSYNEGRIRYSKSFKRYLEFLKVSEYWSAENIEEYRNEKLRKLIYHAYHTVPYYKKIFDTNKLKPSDIRSMDDLDKIPLLSKETVVSNRDMLISSKYSKKNLIKVYTGGTTGARLELYKPCDAIAFQWAVWWRHRMRYGISMDDRNVNFTTKNVVPITRTKPPYWRWNYYMNQLLIGMNQITADKTQSIVDKLNIVGASYFSGPPSLIHSLSSNAIDQGIVLKNKPRYIFYGAENLQSYQRRDIEKFAGAVISDQYGTTEGVSNISRCEELRYHEDFEFGSIEYINPIVEPDGRISYEIVCTGFANDAFPLIRYRIGDRAVLRTDNSLCKCGRQSAQIEEIVGRIEDYVVTPEGHKIMALPVVYSDLSTIKEVQAIQYSPDELILKMVVRDNYTQNDEEFLRRQFRDIISPTLKLKFDYVHSIAREKNGKFRVIKSYINNETNNENMTAG